ncbi:MAG: hypothetical protein WCX73_01330 [Candidatus Pacearchaeota archaeon]|jgi:hypothetical protein
MGNANYDSQMREDLDMFFRVGADRTRDYFNLINQGYGDKNKTLILSELPKKQINSELEELTIDSETMTKFHEIYKELYSIENADFLQQQMLIQNARKILMKHEKTE